MDIPISKPHLNHLKLERLPKPPTKCPAAGARSSNKNGWLQAVTAPASSESQLDSAPEV